MKRVAQHIVDECIRRRTELQQSIGVIAAEVGISKSTTFSLLKGYPLSAERLAASRIIGAKKAGESHRNSSAYRKLADSPFFDIAQKRAVKTDQRGAIAEYAAVFRLLIWGFVPHVALVAGGKSDITVVNPETGRSIRIQAKMARAGKHGAPLFNVTWKGNGKKRKRYQSSDIDVMVAYDLRADKCYVYRFEDIAGRTSTVSVSPDAMERWDRLLSL